MIRYAKIVLEFLHRNFKPFFNLQHVYIFVLALPFLSSLITPSPLQTSCPCEHPEYSNSLPLQERTLFTKVTERRE